MSETPRAGTGLREFLQAEEFWIGSYSARLIREEVTWAPRFLAFFCVMNICVAGSQETPFHTSFVIYLVASLVSSAFALLVVGISFLPRSQADRAGELRDISHEDHLITREIRRLAHAMHCPQPLGILLDEKAITWVPSVSRLDSGVNVLIIPAGILLRDLEEQRALLAHELAHIKHDDLELWLASDRIAAGLRIAALSLFAFLVVSIPIVEQMDPRVGVSHGFNYGSALLGIAAISWRVKMFRQYSETRADLAAVAYADGQALQAVLAELAATSTEEDWDHGNHPDTAERVELVRDATRYWTRMRHGIVPNEVRALPTQPPCPPAASMAARSGSRAHRV